MLTSLIAAAAALLVSSALLWLADRTGRARQDAKAPR
jgi:hypothetical protein